MENKLNHLPNKSRQALIKFTKLLTEAFGDNLYSLILFGSAARASKRNVDDFKEGASDINTAIILENVATNELNVIINIGGKMKKSGLAIPLVFKRGHVPSSLDTFPLEFSDMKQNHILLHGADPLEDANIETGNLRHQCEVEFKGHLVQLRRGYLASGENQEAMTALITASVTSIVATCRGMAMIAGKTPPDNQSDLLKMVQDDYDIDTSAIDEAWRLKHGEVDESTATLEILFDKYLIAIEKLADVVDRM
ncbi:MAG: hypothetical protein GY839_21295 [candidate division Zixibacteria bacterium]|nr:hypothetical protein [candidate division Zixibacteria bacterium]